MENTTEKFQSPPWCIKRIVVLGSKTITAIINLFDPRVCEDCGKEYYYGQTGKRFMKFLEARPGIYERHKYHCSN